MYVLYEGVGYVLLEETQCGSSKPFYRYILVSEPPARLCRRWYLGTVDISRAPGRFVYRLEHPGSQGYWSEEGAIERTKVRLDPLEPLV